MPRLVRSRVSSAIPMEMEVDEDENYKFVKSFLNNRRIHCVLIFPSEILDSDEKLMALFEIWMLENDVSYQSNKEKERRFKGFKENAIWINQINSQPNSEDNFCLNQFGADLPSDPYAGANMTEEEGQEYMQYLAANSDIEV